MSTPPQLKLGINENVSNSEYHSDKTYLSSSVLKTIYKSLEAYKNEYIDGNKQEFSEATLNAFSEGSYVHAAILEPHTLKAEFNMFNGMRKSGDLWQQFLSNMKADMQGKPILSRPQQVRVNSLVDAFKASPCATSLLNLNKPNSHVEYTACALVNEVPIKVRADYISIDDGYIVDIKTTSATNEPGVFKDVCDKLYYHLSGALYARVYESIYSKPFDFYFVTLSKADSSCKVYKLSDKSKALGNQIIDEALAKYKKALETGNWTDEVEYMDDGGGGQAIADLMMYGWVS